MTTRLAVLAAVSVLLSAGPTVRAQAPETRYLTPPPEIAKAIDAAQLPQTILSPNRKVAALVTLSSVPSIADLSQPMLRLAGMRINPETNNQHFNYNKPTIAKLSLISVVDGKERPVSLPERGDVQWVRFSPDGTKIALTQASQRGVALLLVDTTSGAVRQLTQPVLNRTWGDACEWLSDGRALLCRTVPAGRAAATARGEGARRPASAAERRARPQPPGPVRTSSPALTTMRSSSITSPASSPSSMRPPALSRRLERRALFASVSASPNGEYVLVTKVKRPFSRIVAANGFAADVEILDRKGARARLVGSLDLAETVPINGVRTGARGSLWNPAKPATLIWVEALDEGNPATKVPHRDRLQQIDAPFSAAPRDLARTEFRYQAVQFTDKGVGFLTEADREQPLDTNLDSRGRQRAAQARRAWQRRSLQGSRHLRRHAQADAGW